MDWTLVILENNFFFEMSAYDIFLIFLVLNNAEIMNDKFWELEVDVNLVN